MLWGYDVGAPGQAGAPTSYPHSTLGGSGTPPPEQALTTPVVANASDDHLVALDMAFHRALVSLGGSRFLLRSWSALAPVIQTVIATGNRRLLDQDPETHLTRIVESHSGLSAALRARDLDTVDARLRSQFELTASMFADRAPAAP